jgi:hypothetical protein
MNWRETGRRRRAGQGEGEKGRGAGRLRGTIKGKADGMAIEIARTGKTVTVL